ncbi:unnamed protein product [Heligmosomoides polygyrus]|uniref:Uncharacterized protein n=1 Tax=Heligmosomoides polygyrus TaxID=6339 RepID=A0A3P7Z3V9_HELPZ|nr:unnamed protein product [Heligmosomoides polygyrus]
MLYALTPPAPFDRKQHPHLVGPISISDELAADISMEPVKLMVLIETIQVFYVLGDSENVPKASSNVSGDPENVPYSSPNVHVDSKDVPKLSFNVIGDSDIADHHLTVRR